MTALDQYSKWDNLVLSSSDDDQDSQTKVLNMIKSKAASLKDQKHKPTVNFNDDNVKQRAKELFAKKSKQSSKKSKKNKPKKKHIKVYYDPMNIPRHSFMGIFRTNFSPTARIINNSIPPQVLCGNLIHFYYESNSSQFLLLYVIDVLLFQRFTYFYESYFRFVLLLYYFHLIRRLFHYVIDIPLCLFDCRWKDVNHRKLKHWRFVYNFYTFFVLLLSGLLFNVLSFNGPRLGLTQYFRLMFLLKEDKGMDKIEIFLDKSAETGNHLWFGLVYVVIFSIFVDIIYIGLLIYNAADFKGFKRANIGLYFARYASALVKMSGIEVVCYGIVWILKSESDPHFFDILKGIAELKRAAIILPILTVLYIVATWITDKLQSYLYNKHKPDITKKKQK